MAMMRYPFFSPAACSDGSPPPAPLQHRVTRRVRFDELDMLHIVWHGHYASYFEDARVALGDRYGIGYATMKQHRLPAPVKQLFVNYQQPLAFAESCQIVACLHWSEAARMNISYQVINARDETVATGFTVQMFTRDTGEYLAQQPDFYADFCRRWKQGRLPADAG